MTALPSRSRALRYVLACLAIGTFVHFSPLVLQASTAGTCEVTCKNGSCTATGTCTCTCTFWTSTAVCSCSGGEDTPIEPGEGDTGIQ
jgi:hypothetical protein